MDANKIGRVNELIRGASECILAVLEADGTPHVSTVSKLADDGLAALTFGIASTGAKATRLRSDPRASVCFHVEGNNITLVGHVSLHIDSETRLATWQEWLWRHFPGGPEDPEFCVARFETGHVSLWVDDESDVFTMADIAQPQSRCGLLCKVCSFREPYHCGGCIETQGQPFHGACPVAACCQQKGHVHCGQCAELPCDKLRAYSCEDPEHGDRPAGSRIELLRKWTGKSFMPAQSQ